MCVPHHPPPVDFVAQPTNHSPLGFEAQTKKSSWRFCGPNHQIVVAGFEAQIEKPEATGFEAKPGETVALSFKAKLRNSRSSYPCALCKPHTASPDISIVRPSSTRLVLDYPQSSALGLPLMPRFSSLPAKPHLSPTHHEISKRDSPHDR
jgi:hypothetical protein